jgi:hypothetical protein
LSSKFWKENNDFWDTLYVFSVLISIFQTRKIDETHIILAQNFRENNADFD